MGQNFYCPRCNTYITYGTPKCSGCGATFGFTEQIAKENAKNHTRELSQPDIMQIQYLIKNEKYEEAVKLVSGIMKVSAKEAKKIVNQQAGSIGYPKPFPKEEEKKKSFLSKLFRG